MNFILEGKEIHTSSQYVVHSPCQELAASTTPPHRLALRIFPNPNLACRRRAQNGYQVTRKKIDCKQNVKPQPESGLHQTLTHKGSNRRRMCKTIINQPTNHQGKEKHNRNQFRTRPATTRHPLSLIFMLRRLTFLAGPPYKALKLRFPTTSLPPWSGWDLPDWNYGGKLLKVQPGWILAAHTLAHSGRTSNPSG